MYSSGSAATRRFYPVRELTCIFARASCRYISPKGKNNSKAEGKN
jgi:hypothetical protein